MLRLLYFQRPPFRIDIILVLQTHTQSAVNVGDRREKLVLLTGSSQGDSTATLQLCWFFPAEQEELEAPDPWSSVWSLFFWGSVVSNSTRICSGSSSRTFHMEGGSDVQSLGSNLFLMLPSMRPSIHPHPSIYPFLPLSICPSIHIPPLINPSIHPSLSPLPIHPSIHLCISHPAIPPSLHHLLAPLL